MVKLFKKSYTYKNKDGEDVSVKELKDMYDVAYEVCESMLSCFNSVFEVGWISEQMLADFETLEYFMDRHCYTCQQIYDLVLEELEKDLGKEHKFLG